MPRRLGYRALASALEQRATEYHCTGMYLAHLGIPGTEVYAIGDALSEGAALLRSVGRARAGAERLADVAQLRAQATGDARHAWELVRASIQYHLLECDVMVVDPLTIPPTEKALHV